MRKNIWRLSASCLLTLALLCGCQTYQTGGSSESGSQEEARAQQIKTPQQMLEEQPIDEKHDAFLVDTGGALGTLLVTVEHTEGEGADGYENRCLLQIWDPDDGEQPIQAFEKSEFFYYNQSDVVDANFDGYQDFGYMYAMGNQPTFWYYWLWDEEAGEFVEEPAFAEISSPQFDQETQVISGWARDSAATTGVSTFHRWIDGELICVRRIEALLTAEDKFKSVALRVEDQIGGTRTEVFRRVYPGTGNDAWVNERSRWLDLAYQGKPGGVYDKLRGWNGDRWRHAFLVDTGGSMGTLLVTAELGTAGEQAELYVWDLDRMEQPIQKLSADFCQPEDTGIDWCRRGDINFDGYGDFGYLHTMGEFVGHYNFWTWDEAGKQFVPEEGFEALEFNWIDPETKSIYGSLSGNFQWGDGRFRVYEE